jgi:uncharacterized protein YdhG (YjbR/CyaY superfamily)
MADSAVPHKMCQDRGLARKQPGTAIGASRKNTMAKTNFKSVDEYIAAQPEAARGVLERVRSTIREAVPGAEELISYKIPAYRLHGGLVLYFAGWRLHYSLYPATDYVVAAFRDDLAPYEVNKATIRFPLAQPVPVRLIERIAKFRAKEVAECQNARAAAPKKR